MIKRKPLKVETELTLIEDVLCNKCGTSMCRRLGPGMGSDAAAEPPRYRRSQLELSPQRDAVPDSARTVRDLPAVQEVETDAYGLVETTVTGGYLSTALEDYVSYSFSLCEECLAELFDSFKIAPEVSSDLSRWAAPARRATAQERMAKLESEALIRIADRTSRRTQKGAKDE